MTSSLPSLSTILSEPEVARLVAEPGPWWLWTADASRLVAANLTGARAMGATGVGPALERNYSTSHAFAGQVARLVPTLPADGTPRQDRVRIAGRFGSESVTAEAFRLRAGESSLVAVRVPSLRRGTPREAVLSFIADLRIPALAFTEAGSPLAASDASHPLANVSLRDLVGPAHEALTDQIAAEGRAVVDLVTGPMTLVSVPGTGVLMALLAPLAAPQPQSGLRLVAGAPEAVAAAVEAPEPHMLAEPVAVAGDVAGDQAEPELAGNSPDRSWQRSRRWPTPPLTRPPKPLSPSNLSPRSCRRRVPRPRPCQTPMRRSPCPSAFPGKWTARRASTPSRPTRSPASPA